MHAFSDEQRRLNRQSATPGRTIRIRVKRCDAPDKPSRFEEFDIKVERGANVISVLLQIAANPVTASG